MTLDPAPSDLARTLWNAQGFTGAELGWAQLVSEPDAQAAALRFWTARR